eukprot:scaffold147603_cov14-Tisochrysis_lutea.AAC.1
MPQDKHHLVSTSHSPVCPEHPQSRQGRPDDCAVQLLGSKCAGLIFTLTFTTGTETVPNYPAYPCKAIAQITWACDSLPIT